MAITRAPEPTTKGSDKYSEPVTVNIYKKKPRDFRTMPLETKSCPLQFSNLEWLIEAAQRVTERKITTVLRSPLLGLGVVKTAI